MNPVTVFHLRSSSGGGGGPEKTILKTAEVIDGTKVRFLVGYLRAHDWDLSPVAEEASRKKIWYREFPGRRVFDMRQLRSVAAVLRREEVQILHCHEPKSNLYGLLLRRSLPRLVLLSTVHGYIMRSRKSPLYRMLDLYALRRYDHVLAVSEQLASFCRSRGVERVTTVYNAIDTEEWSPRSPAGTFELPFDAGNTFRVGYVGRLSREKGPLDFIKAAALALGKEEDMQFLLAGEGPGRKEAEACAREMGIARRVHFLGAVPPPAMPGLYRQLNLLVQPSRTEGLPNTVLEAMAMRVPVIATDVGGTGELVADGLTGRLVPAGNTSAMADFMVAAKRSPEDSNRMAEDARSMVEERFTMKQRVARIEEIYREAAAG